MALLPSGYLDSVVSIGGYKDGKYLSLATGFLAGFLTGKKSDQGQPFYKTFLVTNRHVFEGQKQVSLRFNLSGAGTKTYDLLLEDSSGKKWATHSNEKIDLAIVQVNYDALINDHIKCSFLPEERFAYVDVIKSQGIFQGDGVFVLGFPMGLSGVEQNYVIVRGGIISRLDDEIIKTEGSFLIDSTVFPGNSGGPVILKPEVASLQGTNAVSQAYILGVVSKYIRYPDAAVSEQTKEVRIVFLENSGLSHIVPMDFIKDCVRPFL